MMKMTEEQIVQWNKAIKDINAILYSTTDNPIIGIALIESIKVAYINRYIVNLPEIFHKLDIPTGLKVK